MAHVDFDRTRFRPLLNPRTELVAQAGFINAIQHPPNRATHKIQRNFRAILGPIGFHDPHIGQFALHHESGFKPELFGTYPHAIGRGFHHQPALIAGTFDACGFNLWQYATGTSRGRTAFTAVGGIRRRLRIGNYEPVIGNGAGEIGRHFQRRNFAALGFVIRPLVRRERTTTGQKQRGNSGKQQIS